MRFTFYSSILLLVLTACASEQATEGGTEATPETTAFTPAAEALTAGKSAAEVGGMLLQAFPAVSDPSTGLVDAAAGKDYVKAATALADKYPGDTLAALPLYKAAEVARAMNDARRAATIYERVYREFPTFSKAGESLFMLAFTYDEDLDNIDKARTTYEEFIAKYPNHGFADDAQMLIGNLGKTDEEVLRELESRNQ